MNSFDAEKRIVSGMRPTGHLHLGNYVGALKNWVSMQHEYECFFFVADWHALTTSYEETSLIESNTYEMVVDWIAAGLSPNSCTFFIQSKVPEHAELNLLLSMITPVSWLERVPTYKDQIQKLNDKELGTHGFLGYPVLQSADILMYRAGYVPVGIDQAAHVEITRDIARRFNHIFGREPEFEEVAEEAINKLGDKLAAAFRKSRKLYTEQGDKEAAERARAMLNEQQQLSIGDQERLHGYLEGGCRIILPEPKVLLSDAPALTGLDGQKMSKSYNNTLQMREESDEMRNKIKRMQTDPARVRRTDPGDPAKCPVFSLHKVFLDDEKQNWAAQGCRSASIGCVECKAPLIDAVEAEQTIFRKRAAPYEDDPELVRKIVLEGSEKARDVAKDTIEDVRAAIGLTYR